MANLLDFIPGLKKQGGEYHGPCGFCRGGEDRFMVFPEQGKDGTGRYWCRMCDEKGDAIDYLREMEGYTFKDAVEALGLPYEPRYEPGADDEALRRRKRRERAIRDADEDDQRRMLREDAIWSALSTAPSPTVERSLRHALERLDTEEGRITARMAGRILADRSDALYQIATRFQELHPGQYRCFVETQIKAPDVWAWTAHE